MAKEKQPNIIEQAELHHQPFDVRHLSSQRISELFQRMTEKEKQAFFQAQMALQSEPSYRIIKHNQHSFCLRHASLNTTSAHSVEDTPA